MSIRTSAAARRFRRGRIFLCSIGGLLFFLKCGGGGRLLFLFVATDGVLKELQLFAQVVIGGAVRISFFGANGAGWRGLCDRAWLLGWRRSGGIAFRLL